MREFIVDEDFHPDVRWYPELIRCCDCINCIKEPNGELYCDILAVGYEPLGSKKVNADWFCADGERKRGGTMDDFDRIVTVMEEQIALCGTDGEHDRITVYMTADDSRRIVEWLKKSKELQERHKILVDCADNLVLALKEKESLISFLEHQREKGHWVFGNTNGHSWMKCSECCVSQSGQTGCWTYCPNCGAEMKGETEVEID